MHSDYGDSQIHFQRCKSANDIRGFLIEYPVGGYEILIKKGFDPFKVCISKCIFEQKNNEMVWGEKEETKKELDERINDMLKWIGKRKEKTIAIVSHSSYIGRMKDRIIGDEITNYIIVIHIN